jgi:hypothetical protein
MALLPSDDDERRRLPPPKVEERKLTDAELTALAALAQTEALWMHTNNAHNIAHGREPDFWGPGTAGMALEKALKQRGVL